MARAIVKTLTTTRVSFKTAVVENGIPSFVSHPDAVFSGVQDKEKVERLLKARLGKDAVIVITNIDAGQHRYEMSMEDFVLNAQIVDTGEDEADDADEEDEVPSEATEDAAEQPAEAPSDKPVSEPAAPAAPEGPSDADDYDKEDVPF